MPAFDPAAFDLAAFATEEGVLVPIGVTAVDHQERAWRRLPEQFKRQPKIVAFLRALVGPCASLETALLGLLTLRGISSASGAQLDVLGQLVDRPRDGKSDSIYRRYIRAQIAANRSDGLIDQLINIARLVVFDDDARYRLRNEGIASYVLEVADVAVDPEVAEALIIMLRRATVVGVRPMLHTNAGLPADAFVADYLPSLDLEPLTDNVDTVVIGLDSIARTLAIALDGAGAGSLTNAGDAWTFHAQSGVTTVANFETALTASSDLAVGTAGTGANLFGAGDVLAATALVATTIIGKGFGELPELDLGPLTNDIDTVIVSRDTMDRTLQIIVTAIAIPELIEAGEAWAFVSDLGVTTVTTFEAMIEASDGFAVHVAGTGANTFDADDEMAAAAPVNPGSGGALSSARE